LFCLPTSGRENDQWRRHRKNLQPAFGPTFLRYGVDVTKDIVKSLFTTINILPSAQRESIDLHQTFTYVALDIIGRIAFSYEFETSQHLADPDHKCYNALKSLKKIGTISKRFSPPFLWPLIGVSVSQLAEHVKGVEVLINHVIETKRASPRPIDKSKHDLVDRILADGV
jgi:cytochrome P450